MLALIRVFWILNGYVGWNLQQRCRPGEDVFNQSESGRCEPVVSSIYNRNQTFALAPACESDCLDPWCRILLHFLIDWILQTFTTSRYHVLLGGFATLASAALGFQFWPRQFVSFVKLLPVSSPTTISHPWAGWKTAPTRRPYGWLYKSPGKDKIPTSIWMRKSRFG